jgi:transcriptional regulator with XRE-family HTH domain
MSLGLSQDELAARTRCNRQSIVRIETASHPPYLDRVFVLADALRLSLGELFQDVDPVEDPQRDSPTGVSAVARRSEC